MSKWIRIAAAIALLAVSISIAWVLVYREMTDVTEIQQPASLIDSSLNAALLEAHASKSDTLLVDCSNLYWLTKEYRLEALRNFPNTRDTTLQALFKADSAWLLRDHPHNTLVSFEKITRFGSKVTVDISISFGLDAGETVEVVLRYKDGRYSIERSGSIWIY